MPAVLLAVLGCVQCLFACALWCMLLCVCVCADVRAIVRVCASASVLVCVVPVGAHGVCCACACDRACMMAVRRACFVRPHSQAKVRRVHVRGFGRIREPKCGAGAGECVAGCWLRRPVGGVGWWVIRWVLCFRCSALPCFVML